MILALHYRKKLAITPGTPIRKLINPAEDGCVLAGACFARPPTELFPGNQIPGLRHTNACLGTKIASIGVRNLILWRRLTL